MSKLTKTAILLCGVFLSFGIFYFELPKHTNGISITLEPGYPATLRLKKFKKQNKFWLLHRPPHGVQGVALVGESEHGKYTLNPKGFTSGSFQFDFGDVPNSSRLSKSKIETLWGKAISDNPDYSTYGLSTKGDTCSVRSTKADFFIDTKFENGYLSSYRFNSVDLHTDWTSADSN